CRSALIRCHAQFLLDHKHLQMSSLLAGKLAQLQQRFTYVADKSISSLCKLIVITGFFLFLIYLLLSSRSLESSTYLANLKQRWLPSNSTSSVVDRSPTNISHIVFGIAGSSNMWKDRKPYIDSWWRPNLTRGYIFFEREPTACLPWPTTSPLYRVSEDTSRYKEFNRHPMPQAIRMFRVILETFREAQKGVRWYVMSDDDTILFLDNLVEMLGRYDHNKYFYIGENSECVLSNLDNSFEMAFGGAGYALSYPLAKALSKNIDVCIKKYPFLYGSDHMMQACVADLGVSLTHEKGFHQIDLRRDVSGLLSSHPQAPLISLHHLDTVDPLFSAMNRTQSLTHLMKAAAADPSRLLQQSICYNKQRSWSISVSWGYSVQLYEGVIIPPSVLQIPTETFGPWRKPGAYRFNTRWLPRNPCENSHLFFFEKVEVVKRERVVSWYGRRPGRRPPGCPSNAGDLLKIIVVSPATRCGEVGNRRECCDIVDSAEKNTTRIKLRTCLKDEIIG
ncbi:hypothetical protein Drorol1_Dr00019119, partial [Drosera rotundifolia]